MQAIKNIELLKKLQPILERRETEYYYYEKCESFLRNKSIGGLSEGIYKTLTLEEMIDLLPIGYILNKAENGYGCHNLGAIKGVIFDGKTLFETVEKMLEFLLDNKYLGT